jgi:hypothetical protein
MGEAMRAVIADSGSLGIVNFWLTINGRIGRIGWDGRSGLSGISSMNSPNFTYPSYQ